MNSTKIHFLCVSTITLILSAFISCTKSSTAPSTKPADSTGTTSSSSTLPSTNTMSFWANGDSVAVTNVSVDTNSFFGYPTVTILGKGIMTTSKDTLSVVFELINRNVVPYSQFTGIFGDTTSTGKQLQFSVLDVDNLNSFMEDGIATTFQNSTVTSNNGTIVSGTFNANLHNLSNAYSTPFLSVTKGIFKVKL